MNPNLIDELRRTCRIDEDYPVKFVMDLKDRTGQPVAGLATQYGIQIDRSFLEHPLFAVLYLHEVAHVVAFRAGLCDTPDDERCIHNKYFGAIQAVLFRRAENLRYMKIYDFADSMTSSNGQGQLPSDETLLRRFAYTIRRSAKLASIPIAIEHIAEIIYREDFEPVWLAKAQQPTRPPRWWW
jgi:hypothetical protein